MTNTTLDQALIKEKLDCHELLTDEEFDALMLYHRWCKDNKYKTKQHISLNEAFEAFADDLYDIGMDKIGYGEQAAHFNDILWKLKKWRSGDSLDIERAKQYPIEQLVEKMGFPIRRNKAKSIYQPDERTPSMHIYTRSNTYWCFATNQGGDTIKFVQDYTGRDFVDAVKFLT